MSTREIDCTSCRSRTLVRAEPLYDGFRKTGEAYVCTACGARYASASETPFARSSARPRVFTEHDLPERIAVFGEDERRHCCGWCAHFVVNPFSQRCGLTNRETQATDLCVRFARKPDPSSGAAPEEARPTSP